MIFFLLRHPPPFTDKQREKLIQQARQLHEEAQTLTYQKEFARAVILMDQYIHICDRLRGFREAARACMDAGGLNAAIAHWGHALSSYRNARWHFKLVKNTAGQGLASAAMGKVLFQVQQFEFAAKELERGRKLLEESGDRKALKEILHNLAMAYRNCRNVAKEMAVAVELVKLCEDGPDEEIKADAYRVRGIAEANAGNKGDGIRWLNKALDMYRTLNVMSAQRPVLDDLAMIYVSLTQYENAVDIVRQTVGIARGTGDATSLCKAIVNLALIEAKAGLYAEARRDLKEAEEISATLKSPDGDEARAQIKMHLADLHVKQRQFESGERLAQEAADAFQKLGDYSTAMVCLNIVADARREKGRMQ